MHGSLLEIVLAALGILGTLGSFCSLLVCIFLGECREQGAAIVEVRARLFWVSVISAPIGVVVMSLRLTH
jgi:hypothetical protein